MHLFVDVFKRLNATDGRYVVVGGLAVVLHGHARLTMDVDLVVSLDTENALAVVQVLEEMGCRPRIPVDAKLFASKEARHLWTTERNLIVFSMVDPANPFTSVDLFVDPPIPFEDLYARSEVHLLDGTPVRVCSLDDLIAMKTKSGRPQDIADIEALKDLDNG